MTLKRIILLKDIFIQIYKNAIINNDNGDEVCTYCRKQESDTSINISKDLKSLNIYDKCIDKNIFLTAQMCFPCVTNYMNQFNTYLTYKKKQDTIRLDKLKSGNKKALNYLVI
jgi:hypothetical protein